jgi:mRNA interferase MazF
VSVDPFNYGPADLTIVLPITSKHKRNPLLVEVDAPEGGLRQKSYIKCYDIRSAAKERLVECWGQIAPQTMVQVEHRLRLLLNL